MNSNDNELSASEWLARLDREDPCDADLEEFAQWRSADPRNAAAYARLAATWQALDRIKAIRPSGNLPIDNDYLTAVVQLSRTASLEATGDDHAPARQVYTADPVCKSASRVQALGVNDAQDVENPPLPARESSELRASEPAAREESALLVPSSDVDPDASSASLAHHPSPSRVLHKRRLFPWISLALAASLSAALAAFWLIDLKDQLKTYSTGIGGFQHIELADQSSIDLNTDTEVRVVLAPTLRKVVLVRGEASFSVAHDASRPFIVSAGDTAVRAVGTKFDVHKLENSVEVTVGEGKVAIGEVRLLEAKIDVMPSNIPQVAAGQTATASGEGVKLKNLPKSDLARKLAWQNQTLVFDADTLADVVAQFNRYNARQLVIADPKISTLRIGGYFRPTNLDAFISVLQSDFRIRADVQGNRLVLTPIVSSN